jgi:hypothetical protein
VTEEKKQPSRDRGKEETVVHEKRKGIERNSTD